MKQLTILVISVILAFVALFVPWVRRQKDDDRLGLTIDHIDLCDVESIDAALVGLLTELVFQHGYVTLKRQCRRTDHAISPSALETIASHFGEPQVYGISLKGSNLITELTNNGSHSARITGSEGWHLDGTMHPKPNSICLNYVQHAPRIGTGGTKLIKSKHLLREIKQMDPKMYDVWKRLFFYTRGASLHPVIARHPVTGHDYMCIHTAYAQQFIEVLNVSVMVAINERFKGQSFYSDEIKSAIRLWGKENVIRLWGKDKTTQFLREMERHIEQSSWMHVTSYERGDLLIRDNLALLHIAHPTAREPVEDIGLRKIWRIALQGQFVTTKF